MVMKALPLRVWPVPSIFMTIHASAVIIKFRMVKHVLIAVWWISVVLTVTLHPLVTVVFRAKSKSLLLVPVISYRFRLAVKALW